MVNQEEKKKIQAQKLLELSVIDTRLHELEKALVMLEHQVSELQLCQLSLDELSDVKLDSEMLAAIGPGIFVKAKLQDNKKVLVDVGVKTLCVKSLEEAKATLQQKLDRLMRVRSQLEAEIKALIQSASQLEQQLKES